jgi:DNA segregation ATPase FtsK/SpoIIIE, S-DNA-T family
LVERSLNKNRNNKTITVSSRKKIKVVTPLVVNSEDKPVLRESLAILMGLISFYFFFALLITILHEKSSVDVRLVNLIGKVGSDTAKKSLNLFGLSSIFAIWFLSEVAISIWRGKVRINSLKSWIVAFRCITVAIATISLASVLESIIVKEVYHGGLVGSEIGSYITNYFGNLAGTVICLFLVVLGVLITTQRSATQVFTSLNKYRNIIFRKVNSLFILAFSVATSKPSKQLAKIGIKGSILSFKALSGLIVFLFKKIFSKKEKVINEIYPKVIELKPPFQEVQTILTLPPLKNVVKSNAKNTIVSSKVFAFEGEYIPPKLTCLTEAPPFNNQLQREKLDYWATLIKQKLRDFNIDGEIREAHQGPVITLYEFEPAPGVKVNRIVSLQDDLAMSLRASSIRIVAPLPKRGAVGIEVPNEQQQTVYLRSVLESEEFCTSDSSLSIPMGKDAYGNPVILDIAQMPHLLIAGATGTGKSVCLNTILTGLIFRASPAAVGLILIDPKILELSVYEMIPHLRVPVVTVPRQAKAVLQWAVTEMDRRYRMMKKLGVRNLDSYNDSINNSQLNDSEPLQKIVIVIDELADLMLQVGRDIEVLITRLAQKARAAGIHLIVATQRPSVDVITGLIKANFPARVSFRVTSKIDSRTILDSSGAEALLGRGDMLIMQPGAGTARRVHGAFISDDEVAKVVDQVKLNGAPMYDEGIIAACEKALEEACDFEGGGSSDGLDLEELDPIYDKAVALVTGRGQASSSMIQRAFRIGYNRAARIIDMMEREGVVGPMDGAKAREVLVPPIDE